MQNPNLNTTTNKAQTLQFDAKQTLEEMQSTKVVINRLQKDAINRIDIALQLTQEEIARADQSMILTNSKGELLEVEDVLPPITSAHYTAAQQNGKSSNSR
jgi:hypothetical protein